jgi:hypothetical protein
MKGQDYRREIGNLKRENELLRAELQNQWELNHSEFCGGWPHPNGKICCYPQPPILLSQSSRGGLEASISRSG